MKVEQRRLTAALFVVAIAVSSVPLADLLHSSAHAQASVDAGSAGVDVGALAGAGDIESALAALDELADIGSSGAVSAEFEREIGLLPGAHDVLISGSVVGYLIEGESAQVEQELQVHMAARGWTSVPLGELEGATFVKPSGDCTWALVTCTQVGDVTSVVVRSNAT